MTGPSTVELPSDRYQTYLEKWLFEEAELESSHSDMNTTMARRHILPIGSPPLTLSGSNNLYSQSAASKSESSDSGPEILQKKYAKSILSLQHLLPTHASASKNLAQGLLQRSKHFERYDGSFGDDFTQTELHAYREDPGIRGWLEKVPAVQRSECECGVRMGTPDLREHPAFRRGREGGGKGGRVSEISAAVAKAGEVEAANVEEAPTGDNNKGREYDKEFASTSLPTAKPLPVNAPPQIRMMREDDEKKIRQNYVRNVVQYPSKPKPALPLEIPNTGRQHKSKVIQPSRDTSPQISPINFNISENEHKGNKGKGKVIRPTGDPNDGMFSIELDP
ncbi:MAG: hypothetical protein MMC33_009386 [Icmadophila ericetorum]|nr:hypothetical protein [Icmadophila ericetorum]